MAVDQNKNMYSAGVSGVNVFNAQATPIATVYIQYQVTINGIAVDASPTPDVYMSIDDHAYEYPFAGLNHTSESGLLNAGSFRELASAGTTIYGAGFVKTVGATGYVFEMPPGNLVVGTRFSTAYDPDGVAVDGLGNIYVVGTTAQPAQRYSQSGTLLTEWGNFSAQAVATDDDNNIYIGDVNVVRKFSP